MDGQQFALFITVQIPHSVIDHLLSIQPYVFWLAGYPRNPNRNPQSYGTDFPIDRGWTSPFIGHTEQQCWDWLLQTNLPGIDGQRFGLVDEALEAYGIIKLCFSVSEEKRQEWIEYEMQDGDEESVDGVPEAGVHCFDCEAGKGWFLVTASHYGDGWEAKVRGYSGGYADKEDPQWFARAEAAGAVEAPEV